ncbi:hypothetical protein [Micromonospora sp. LOL_021]|uniref:hypothetical protein n=1 Tax=Micromonospora sp. LOL_021 TaxID=3345417 RepID=UPI003A846B3F
MRLQITKAVNALQPVLQTPDTDTDGLTVTLREVLRARATPSTAVYFAWDLFGRCRYVGSVRRPKARAAVRDRLREHLGHDDRRAGWHALTVLPLRPDLDLERVRLCEGWVARLLVPLDGCTHPMLSAEMALAAFFEPGSV